MVVNTTTRAEAPAAGVPLVLEDSERARQREIATYLSAASFPPGLTPGPAEPPILSSDATLNALVQLGAIRLDCDRSFVSLIDRQYQYVIAEMTRTHSIAKYRAAPNDGIFLGVCKLEVYFGVCPKTMKAFLDETGEWVQTGPNIIADTSRYIINDFREEPDFKNLTFVTGHPHMVSYLEVPLVSPLGYLVGSYCVVDNRPRDYDNDAALETMTEIASSIMAHLEHVKIKKNRHRSEQLIDGLCDFIGFDPTAPHSTQANSPSNMPQKTSGTGSSTTEPNTVLESSVKPSGLAPNGNSVDAVLASYLENSRILSPSTSTEQSVSAPDSISFPSAKSSGETPLTTPRDEALGDPMEQHVVTGDAIADLSALPPKAPTSGSEVSELHASGFVSSANIKSTFFRAAVTIRQAMNMDGLTFLDAVPSAFGDRSDQPTPDGPLHTPPEDVVGPFCPVIVQSASDQAVNTASQPSQFRLPEAVLQTLIRKFPRGHILSADEFGPIDDSYGPGQPFQHGRRSDPDTASLTNDVATLFSTLPRAKYVIFLPLWHFQRECWYAAALGWVSDPTRALGVADVRLVSAFGNSVMVEVSRLEAMAASRAKTNFVSSISHELRSPLHGIMASSELLREGITDSSLLSTLDMLDSCGSTLLDTFNNLLDHAIAINAGNGSASASTDLKVADLGVLVEDVLEAVQISNASQNSSKSSKKRDGVYSLEKLDAGKALSESPPLVTLTIGKRMNWKLPIDVGAWKRIVMNLFSNALKYTGSGCIEVSLNTIQSKDSTSTLCDHVSFLVKDTGRGMGSDFIKYQLFTPFSQENGHSPGMGLGLSIVQQLVSGLRGTVDIRSSVGIGTRVEVLIPLKQEDIGSTPNGQPAPDMQQPHEDNCHQLNGRTMCLITPDAYRSVVNKSLEVDKEIRQRSAVLERALRVNAGEVLGINVVLGTTACPVPQADFYVLDDHVISHESSGGFQTLLATSNSAALPLVFLCTGPDLKSCSKQKLMNPQTIHLHQPLGPKKLVNGLLSALKTDTKSSEVRFALGAISAVVPELDNASSLSLKEGKEKQEQSHDHGPPEIQQPSTEIVVGPSILQPTAGHFLLVDDNPINIKLLAMVVGKLNCTFVTASHGLDAVQLYHSSLEEGRPFDIVFMDISMPIMDGFEATRQIRKLEDKAGVARCMIVALTGLSSDLNRNEALTSGCDLFFTKPVKMDKVRILLNEKLGRRR